LCSPFDEKESFRNDILVVVSLIIGLKPDAPIVETGFAKQLLLFASFPERKLVNREIIH